MHLKSLSVRQFRNYSRLDLSLSPGLNVLCGPNGSGKSNLLEAVAFLCAGQSHRGADPRHLLQWEKEGFSLSGAFEGEDPLTLEVRQKKGRARQVLLDGRPQKRIRDWAGRAPVVSFSPDDLHLVKGEPALRRRFLNAVLCQVDGRYWETLERYQKILEERNAALRQVREEAQSPSVLEPWDLSLLKEGLFLSFARRDFLADFDGRAARQHLRLSGGRERVRLTYKPSLLLSEEGPEAALAANRKRLQDLREGEIALGSTLAGPHRDDVELSLDDAPARAYASQGQQRTLAMALKRAEQEYLAERLGRRPLCLLDDVLSELDPARRDSLVEAFSDGAQCLVTLTSAADWPGAAAFGGNGSRLFQVRDGALAAGGGA